MDKYFRDKCPSWVNETDRESDLILGDDIDSLASCRLLKKITGGKWKVNYFYDFAKLYKDTPSKLPAIGVDMAFCINGMKCFDNHVTRQFVEFPNDNTQMMNLNLFFGTEDLNRQIAVNNRYYWKYGLSTLLMIMSYYQIPLPKTQLGKELLLTIDTSFKGHYRDAFSEVHTFWLDDVLQFPELVDVLDQHDPDYFYGLMKKFRLNEKIFVGADSNLITEIDLDSVSKLLNFDVSLPIQEFKLKKEFDRCGHRIGTRSMPRKEEILTMAFTSTNYVSYTTIKEA